jgi:hypothetical protein
MPFAPDYVRRALRENCESAKALFLYPQPAADPARVSEALAGLASADVGQKRRSAAL